jgi:REP element-mobilizing transposase RayT
MFLRMITRSRKVVRRRPRKRHIQLELVTKRDKNGQRRGGRRKGAGRPPRDERRSSERHKKRPPVDRRHPQNITLRVMNDVGYLRKPHMYRAVRGALMTVLDRDDFRIVHFSIQGNHIHLVCEAENKLALAKGMKGFEISAAKRLNDEMTRERGQERKGQVFADRYHVRAITSVREVRNCLAYVLNNFRRHGLSGPTLFDGKLDYYSSALLFPGWKERTTPTIHIPPDYEAPAVARPQTWLLAEGYKRAKPISVYETPGPRT